MLEFETSENFNSSLRVIFRPPGTPGKWLNLDRHKSSAETIQHALPHEDPGLPLQANRYSTSTPVGRPCTLCKNLSRYVA
jgi:hypothetical protein